MKFVLDENGTQPQKAHPADAGWDIFAAQGAIVPPYGFAVIDTGLHVEIADGYYGAVRSRSSLMLHGITTDGTIDSGYTGEIKVVLFNHGGDAYLVNAGDRVAQLVLSVVPDVQWIKADRLADTPRGCGGFGSSGK